MSNTVKVFEQSSLCIDEQGFQQHHWTSLAKFNVKHGSKYFTLLPDGIRFNQYVGAIQAGNLTIEILPKIDNDGKDENDWHKALLQMLKECQHLKVSYTDLATLQLQSASILDIYLYLFLDEIEKLLHAGLIKKYRKVEANQSALKGKLLFQQQLNKNIVHQERFYVQYSTYDREHLIHRILYKTIRFVRSFTNNSGLKSRANRLLLDFPEMKDLNIIESTFTKIPKTRKTAVYEQSLLISKMLLLNYRPDITGGQENVLALLFDMNRLWEEYVYRQLVKLDDTWDISSQHSVDFWAPEGNKSKTLRPDIVIRNHKDKGAVVIDTKWKVFDDEYPADSDLQQMFAYAHYVESAHLILLYPAKKKDLYSGSYVKDHFVKTGLYEATNVNCSLLKVPLRWNADGEFIGLDLEASNLLSKTIG